MKKSISIAIATYNGAKYLREQLDSIYAQDLLPDEVVVSDDGSTDETLTILEEYHQKYGLLYSVNDGEHGVNHNFYRAISLCTKDIIAICDQDDIWLPNKISVSYNKLIEIENNKPACVSSLCNHIDSKGHLISNEKDEKDTFGYDATLLTYGKGQNRSQGCSLMFNKALKDIILIKIKMYPEIKVTMFYDAFIAFTAAVTGHKYNLGERLMLYRHHSSNVLAKENQSKQKLLNRIQKNEYFLFIPQRRLYTISKMIEWFPESEMNKDTLNLCKKISKISKGTHLKGLIIILTLKELSLFRKIQIFSGTIAMDIIKLFIN